MNVLIALTLIALGMGLDAFYQRRIRIAECDAYDAGYKQGKVEEQIKLEMLKAAVDAKSVIDSGCIEKPSMAAPVEMPPTFEERMRKHGRAVVKLK